MVGKRSDRRWVNTLATKRYQIEVTLIGRKFFALVGGFPAFGIAESITKNNADVALSVEIQSLIKDTKTAPTSGFSKS
jgi:hypothetical protein